MIQKELNNQNLITKHNTYLVVTKDYVQKQRLKGKFFFKKSESKQKVSLKKRNSTIIQIGHSTQWKTFITLTFSPEYYWDDLTLIQQQFRKFLKKFYYKKINFKYLAVLEYGEQTSRIHYHMLTDIQYSNSMFEYSPYKQKQIKIMGDKFYNSNEDRKVCNFWNFGWSDVKEVNNENCNAVFYLAKYLTKNNENRTPIGKREVFSSRGLNKITKRIVNGNIIGVKGYKLYLTKKNTSIYVKLTPSKEAKKA